MGKFDGILICTDLDGTLYKNDKTVSAENSAAIEYFKSEGGIFTFVTGRMPFYSRDAYERVKPNAPAGCINGAGLYDFEKDEYIWNTGVTNAVNGLVKHVEMTLPEVGIQVNTFYKAYFCRDNSAMQWFRKVTSLPNTQADYEKISEPFAKIIFASDHEDEIIKLSEVLNSHPDAEKFDFIRTEKKLFEIMPKGIGKGIAITKLCEHLGINPGRTIAIGDYNNDVSMLETAKIGVAVSNACSEVLNVADYVTVSNEEHAIAQIISDIECGKLNI